MNHVHGSSLVTIVLRYRFERVGGNFKIQRPYVMTLKALSLKKDKPMKLSK